MPQVVTRTLLLLLSFAALLCSGIRPLAAQEEDVPVELLLPPEVRIFFTIPDAAETKKKWNEAVGKILNDPEFAEARQEIDRQWKRASEKVEAETGVSLDDLVNLPSGEVSFALWITTGRKIAAATILDYGDSQQTVDTLLEKAHERLTERGATRAVQDFEDAKIVVYTLKDAAADADADAAAAPAERTVAYFLRDNYLVVGNSQQALQDILVRWDGAHTRTFAGNEIDGYIKERCTDEGAVPAFRWFVDPIGLLQHALTGEKASFETQMVLAFLPQLGLNQLRGVGGAFDFGTEKYESISRTLVYVDQPARGLLNLFQFPVVEQSPPAWVPATTQTYFAANWNVAAAYSAVETLYDSFRGPGEFGKLIDQAVERADGPPFHPKRDFIDQLTGRLHVVSEAVEDEDAPLDEPPSESMVIALEVKDPNKISAVLTELAQAPAFTGKTRQFRGYTIYELPSAANAEGGTMGMTVFSNSLMISSDVVYLEQVLLEDRERETLANSAKFKKVAAEFPARASIIGFQGQDAQIERLYELLRSGHPQYQLEGLDFSSLPPFSAFEKYLQPSGTYVTPDRNGAFIVSFSPAQ